MNDYGFLTIKECADHVGVSKMTIYRLVHQGAVPSVRVGRSIRIPAGAWRRYLQENAHEPRSQNAD
jgi:excisionase family DNA binding protein